MRKVLDVSSEEEEKLLDCVCEALEIKQGKPLSDKNKKRVKNLYYKDSLPLPSFQKLIDIAYTLDMWDMDFLIDMGRNLAEKFWADWDAQIARQEKLTADKLSEDAKELSAWPEVNEEIKIYDMPYSVEAVMDFYDTYKNFGMKFYSALQEEDGRTSTKAVLLYEGGKPTVHYQMEDGTKLSVSEGDPGFRAMMERLHKFYPGTSLLG